MIVSKDIFIIWKQVICDVMMIIYIDFGTIYRTCLGQEH